MCFFGFPLDPDLPKIYTQLEKYLKIDCYDADIGRRKCRIGRIFPDEPTKRRFS